MILISIFAIFWSNYGVLYLIGPMDISIPGFGFVSKGIYSDFNQAWYQDVGYQIISVQLINAIAPALEAAGIWLWIFVRRSYDQRRCCRQPKPELTSQKTYLGYKDLYSGPNFEVYYQYSQMLVITWITFMFAPGLPILFPIGLFGLITLYVTNRLCLAYLNK